MIEAPVNGGRNYRKRIAAARRLHRRMKGRADLSSYVNKLGYMLETPVYPTVLASISWERLRASLGEAVTIRQVRTISRKGSVLFQMAQLNVKSIPDGTGCYLAGFADGEGGFNVVFRKRKDYRNSWKISLCFNVSQKDRVIPALFKRHLKCGSLRSRGEGVWCCEVNSFVAIQENVIPFFRRFGFLSAKKKRDFSKFREIAAILAEGRHLQGDGVREVLEIRQDMSVRIAMTEESESIPIQTFSAVFPGAENPQRLHAKHCDSVPEVAGKHSEDIVRSA